MGHIHNRKKLGVSDARRETTLRALRRMTFGTYANAVKALSLSRLTLYRAETGKPVSAETKKRLEAAFGLPFSKLKTPFVNSIIREAASKKAPRGSR